MEMGKSRVIVVHEGGDSDIDLERIYRGTSVCSLKKGWDTRAYPPPEYPDVIVVYARAGDMRGGKCAVAKLRSLYGNTLSTRNE